MILDNYYLFNWQEAKQQEQQKGRIVVAMRDILAIFFHHDIMKNVPYEIRGWVGEENARYWRLHIAIQPTDPHKA